MQLYYGVAAIYERVDMSKAVIVVPTLNEAEHIADVVHALSTKDADGNLIPIWIVDGKSADGTADLVKALNLTHVTVIDNPMRTQAHAINLAAELAANEGQVDYLIRADAHAHYTTNFSTKLLETLQETQADSVVVPLKTVGGTKLQAAAAVLFGSWLGTGGSPHRTGVLRGYVDHGHHAAFRLDAYLRIGGYDTDFRANEDAEFDYRLIASGGKIFLENEIAIDYVPRPSVIATFRQYQRNGKYRIRRAIKHNVRLGLRQLIPALLLPILTASLLLAVTSFSIFSLVPIGYVFAIALASFIIAKKAHHSSLATLMACLAASSHLGFSAGASLEFLRCLLSPERKKWLQNDRDRLISNSKM